MYGKWIEETLERVFQALCVKLQVLQSESVCVNAKCTSKIYLLWYTPQCALQKKHASTYYEDKKIVQKFYFCRTYNKIHLTFNKKKKQQNKNLMKLF